jgi:hypothetical protein
MAEAAEEASADGGVPVNEDLSGRVGRALKEAPPPSSPLSVLHETSAAPPTSTVTSART